MRSHLLLAALPIIALPLSGCIGQSQLERAHADCEKEFSEELPEYAFQDYIALGDGGRTVTVTHPGTEEIEEPHAIYQASAFKCVLTDLEVTDAIDAELGQTTALMGRQEESWGDFTMSWSYHPDSGISAVVTQE